MCIDYQMLNKATRKDHFPLPFIDEMLERLAKHSYFYYLDGNSGYHQIPIHPDDQNKTTITARTTRSPIGECPLVSATHPRLSSVYDGDLLWLDREHHGSFHG